ncbi:uncharacterized protein LOC131010251 [Salvia miltiorrhiza]|uniref:uncharacterized protein LOC131010251 n=1 Tax=Salvia miltiorrhiza TaxID=226208 RepID=UPI0025AB8D5A|nr:uncharacterized protein LOC131010251 [Salvia miltiorrhiza]
MMHEVGTLSLLLQKCTTPICQLSTGVSADTFNEYLKVADTTRRLCLKRFCKAVIWAYSGEYLQRPTQADIQHLLQMHEARHGFHRMLGSLDCMHWAWKSCPKAWHDAYTRGDQGEPTLILKSPLFSDVLDGTAAPVIFEANRHYYQMGYYLCDGLYPEWCCFVKSPPMVTNPNEARFKKMQQSAQKDVERAFGVLQARWKIIRSSAQGIGDFARINLGVLLDIFGDFESINEGALLGIFGVLHSSIKEFCLTSLELCTHQSRSFV